MTQRTQRVPRAHGPVSAAPSTQRRLWSVAPSDFAFLWDECQRCFYDKVVRRRRRPSTPFPSVFSRIDLAMKARCAGARTEKLAGGAPNGTITETDRSVQSCPLVVPGSESRLVVRGRADALMTLDQGGIGVIDFKTAPPAERLVERYARQLHAYAAALEDPAVGPARAVERLGLLAFVPATFVADYGEADFRGRLCWTEVPLDRHDFNQFLTDVVAVLDGAEPPAPDPNCPWCRRGLS